MLKIALEEVYTCTKVAELGKISCIQYLLKSVGVETALLYITWIHVHVANGREGSD